MARDYSLEKKVIAAINVGDYETDHDKQIYGAGPDAKERSGVMVTVFIPDELPEVDPLETYKRETGRDWS